MLGTIRLHRVIVPVNDIEKAATFYAQIFGHTGERMSAGRHFFDVGGPIVACYDSVAEGDDAGSAWKHHPNQYLYFAVFDLYGTKATFEDAGGTVTKDIEQMPWGEMLFHGVDPFGNPICFVDETTLHVGVA
jgi:predicted enzyme related to lactoylglutathione lyase